MGTGSLLWAGPPAEVEQQPLQRHYRNRFSGVGNEIAFGDHSGRNRTGRPLKTDDGLDRNLRRVTALDQPHGERRLARLLPGLVRLWVEALRKVDELGKIVAMVSLDRSRYPRFGVGRTSQAGQGVRLRQSPHGFRRRWNHPWLLRGRRRELSRIERQRGDRRKQCGKRPANARAQQRSTPGPRPHVASPGAGTPWR